MRTARARRGGRPRPSHPPPSPPPRSPQDPRGARALQETRRGDVPPRNPSSSLQRALAAPAWRQARARRWEGAQGVRERRGGRPQDPRGARARQVIRREERKQAGGRRTRGRLLRPRLRAPPPPGPPGSPGSPPRQPQRQPQRERQRARCLRRTSEGLEGAGLLSRRLQPPRRPSSLPVGGRAPEKPVLPWALQLAARATRGTQGARGLPQRQPQRERPRVRCHRRTWEVAGPLAKRVGIQGLRRVACRL
ncbi:hypothetical protein T484DRAFT_1982108 [Baffinella frigidus]|nr:hypothetical protein T484DRAFT_1982108 [Cryptophyta sp. CCMP2293]